jgi:Domain of unknown function (DUF5122) beta-propeller
MCILITHLVKFLHIFGVTNSNGLVAYIMCYKDLLGTWKALGVVLVSAVILSSCGSGSGSKRYTVSGTVSGLAEGSFELHFTYQDADYLYTNIYESTGNGDFTLDIRLPSGTPYSAYISRMPETPAQHCTLDSRGGIISGAVTDFNITCYKYKKISVVANGSDGLFDLTVAINIGRVISPINSNDIVAVNEIIENDYSPSGDVQIYSAQIIENSSFNISVLSPPYPQNQQVCYINQSSGVAAEDDINIQINCMKAGSIGGSVIGLQGGNLVIQNNGDSSLTISQDGLFTFSDLFPIDSDYEISVASNPGSPNQLCKIDNGTGTLIDFFPGNTAYVTRITNVTINCYDKPVVNATSLNAEVVLDWPDITADRYNVYYSSDKSFDPGNYTAYADGAFLQDVTSPLKVTGLENRKGYYFVLEAEHNIKLPYSDKAGARPDNLVVNDAVNSITTNNAGDIYIGGRFTKVRAVSGQGIPLSLHNSSLSIADYPLVNGKVTASVSDGAGGWYIGGDFTGVGGIARGKLAHILSDGTLDPLWHPDVEGVSIQALYYLNNIVYVGGEFTTVDGNPHQNFVAIGTDGSIKPWNLDSDGVVHAFTSSGSVMYMGGSFTTVGGTARSRIAAFDGSGVITSFNVDITGAIYCMQAYNNALYIGGRLGDVAGINTASRAIALNLNGTLTGWDSGTNGGIIEDLIVHNDIVFFAGSLYSGTIDAVHVDGRHVSIKRFSGYAHHLEIIGDKLIVAGDKNIAAYNLNTNSLTLNPNGLYYDMNVALHRWNPAIHNEVTSMAISGDSIYVGGKFNGLGGIERNNLLSINADGTLSDWNPKPNGAVNSVIEDNGTVYVGGVFTQIGLDARKRIAAIDLNGEATAWNPVIPDVNASVNTLFKDNNTLYIGGGFTSINGQNRNNIAAIQFDGTLLDWMPDVDSNVNTINKNNGNLYIGGLFTTVNGLGRTYIASFDSAGDLTNWAPDISDTGRLSPTVNTILPIGNNIYFGGRFNFVNGSGRNYTAAVNESGVLTSWNPDITYNDQLLSVSGIVYLQSVNDLAYYQNEVVVGGGFSTVGVSTRNSLALVGENGVLNTWNPDVNGYINTLHALGGTLFVGGSFSGLSLDSQSNFAVYDSNGVLQ